MQSTASDKNRSGSAELRRVQMIVSFQQGMSSDAQGRVASDVDVEGKEDPL